MKIVESNVEITSVCFLSFSFIGEESVAAGEKSVLTDNPTWIIDPIDGTTNFVHRYVFKFLIELLFVYQLGGPLEYSAQENMHFRESCNLFLLLYSEKVYIKHNCRATVYLDLSSNVMVKKW